MKDSNEKKAALKALLTGGVEAFKAKTEGSSIKLYTTEADGVVYRIGTKPGELIALEPDELEYFNKNRKNHLTLNIDKS